MSNVTRLHCSSCVWKRRRAEYPNYYQRGVGWCNVIKRNNLYGISCSSTSLRPRCHADRFYPHLLPSEWSISSGYCHFVSNLVTRVAFLKARWRSPDCTRTTDSSSYLRFAYLPVYGFMIFEAMRRASVDHANTTIRKIKMHFHISRCLPEIRQVTRNIVRVTGAITRRRGISTFRRRRNKYADPMVTSPPSFQISSK